MGVRRFPTLTGTLYYGPMPTDKELRLLRMRGVETIWNLAQELGTLSTYEKSLFKQVIDGNVKDYSIPSNFKEFISQANHIANLLRQNKKVFVHCQGGRGRTGTALAAVLIALEKIPAEEALDMVDYYVKGPDTLEQEDFIKHIEEFLTGKKEGRIPKFDRSKYKTDPVNSYDWTKWYDKYMKEPAQEFPNRVRVEDPTTEEPKKLLEPECSFCRSNVGVTKDSQWLHMCKKCRDKYYKY